MKKIILLGAFISLSCLSMERESNNFCVMLPKHLPNKLAVLPNYRPGSIEFRILEKSINKDFETLSPRDYKIYKRKYLIQKEAATINALQLLREKSIEPSSSSSEGKYPIDSPRLIRQNGLYPNRLIPTRLSRIFSKYAVDTM